MQEHIHFKDQQSFRKWLEKNHERTEGIWMIYYKKHTQKPNIEYTEALDEALCFGWIDSMVRRIDEESYVRKFTPRRNIKTWSEVNKVKAMRLIQEEKMTIHGLNKIESYVKTGEVKWEKEKAEIYYGDLKNTPQLIREFLYSHELEWEKFKNLAPSYRKEFTRYILQAKREETRTNRLNKLLISLQNDLRPGML